MELSCSNIKKILIFSQKKPFLIFPEKEPFTSQPKSPLLLLLPKKKKFTLKLIPYISGNETFQV